MTPTFSLVINAGGQSRRMGQDKALLTVPTNQQPLLAHIMLRLHHLPIDQIIVVSNHLPATPIAALAVPVTFVSDAYSGAGALGGMATGLEWCSDWGIFVACDMPLVRAGVFEFLCELAGEEDANGASCWDAVVPRIDGYAQPLHALYQRSVLPAIQKRLAAGELRATSFLDDVRVRWVSETELCTLDPDFCSFFNANTPEEWQTAIRWLANEI